MRQRRYLPSISMLLAFEAVMARGSVTAAAEELSLTQSTVSRLIQTLEGQVGATLFLRQRQRLVPTEAARDYHSKVGRSLDMLQRATMGLVTSPGGGSLDLGILPTFGTRWLAPRLGGFFDRNPGVTVTLATRLQSFSFEAEGLDAGILFGEEAAPGTRRMKLFGERYTACASPGFLARHPIGSVADMRGLPLLQLETRPTAWADWAAGQGGDSPRTVGMVMDQFSMMIQAALSGLGIALLPHYLAVPELEDGRLRAVLQQHVPGTGAYWLVWPERNDSLAALAAFRDWLAGECRDAAHPGPLQPGVTA
ncbi:LysR family transcriptional regulator [Chachezhania sediminis]|uniref:LysR family transcriptional regulator n=1 Tax=Chachezhania sediminis TaxID=2599291 RepID=UPI00131DF119|nr:LysR family transcriptional regulator [Chachezhania sediminis]